MSRRKSFSRAMTGSSHLETTAKRASFFYGTANNAVRTETPEEAAALDDRLIAAWSAHPHFRLIENLNGFENKMRHLIAGDHGLPGRAGSAGGTTADI